MVPFIYIFLNISFMLVHSLLLAHLLNVYMIAGLLLPIKRRPCFKLEFIQPWFFLPTLFLRLLSHSLPHSLPIIFDSLFHPHSSPLLPLRNNRKQCIWSYEATHLLWLGYQKYATVGFLCLTRQIFKLVYSLVKEE